MKKQLTILCTLAAAALSGLYFSGCTSTESPATGAAPYGLMANSLDQDQIGLRWTRDASDVTDDTVVVTASDGSTVAPRVVVSPGVSTQVTGLHTGVTYTFSVHSQYGASVSLPWMTAIRTNGIKLYQYSSSQPSGLLLTATGASAVSVTNSAMDFYLEDAEHNSDIPTPPGLSFESAVELHSNFNESIMDSAPRYVIGGLTMDYASTDFTTIMSRIAAYRGHTYDISNASNYNTVGSRVLLAETHDGHFARIEIVPDPTTNQLYSGSGTSKYVTVNVSYQPIAGKPYAARPHQYNPGVIPPRNPVK